MRALDDPGLDALLASVSRSFYLSLRILPRAVRGPLSSAYLVARAADTIADTATIARDRRRALLAELRVAIEADDPAPARALAAAVRAELAAPAPPAPHRSTPPTVAPAPSPAPAVAVDASPAVAVGPSPAPAVAVGPCPAPVAAGPSPAPSVRASAAGAPSPAVAAAESSAVGAAPSLAVGATSAVADGAAAAERLLLARLDDCLALLAREAPADRSRARRVLDALLRGMERDLVRFDGATAAAPLAVASRAELDEHCYLAAGCVGEYWTATTAAHIPAVAHLAAPHHVAAGVRLGKALQLVNVLRDAPADLADGRCYLPADALAALGLAPRDLLDPSLRRRARPLLDELHALALAHVDAAWGYVRAIPPTEPRLRLACVWPLWIALATLARLAALDDPLDGAARVKVPRREVYRLLAASTAAVMVDPLLEALHRRRRRLAELAARRS